MLAISIIIALIIFFVSFSKPLYGIILLLFNFLLQPHVIFGFLGYPQSATQLCNLLIGTLLFVSLPSRKLKNPESGISRQAILLAISVALSSLFNDGTAFFTDKYKWPEYISFLNRVGFIFLFSRYVCTRDDFSRVLKTIVVLGSATAVYTVVDYFFRLSSAAYVKGGRAVGVQGDPNLLAANLVAMLPLAYYLFVHGSTKWLKRLHIFSITSLVLAVFFTVSRGGLLALLFVGGSLTKKNIKRFSTIIVMGLMLILFSLYAKDLFLKRTTIETTLSGRTSLESSAANRIQIIREGLNLWLHNPIFGVGLTNTKERVKEQLHQRGIAGGSIIMIHNAYMLVLAEFGSIGFLLYMGFFLLAFKALARLSRHQDAYFNEIAGYLRIALLSHMITSCFLGNWYELMLWITLALPVVLEQISKNEQNAASQG